MKPPTARCKCLHCKQLFVPDYRNRGRQRYCSATACQKASKRSSQARWLSKPENRHYFCGPTHVRRVQQWRAEHPGYGRRQGPKPRRTLQDACPEQVAGPQELVPKEAPQVSPAPQVSRPALQELCQVQTPLLVGLIAQFTDTALQEDIVALTRRLIARGQDILDQPSRRLTKGNTVYAAKTSAAARAPAPGAGPV